MAEKAKNAAQVFAVCIQLLPEKTSVADARWNAWWHLVGTCGTFQLLGVAKALKPSCWAGGSSPNAL